MIINIDHIVWIRHYKAQGDAMSSILIDTQGVYMANGSPESNVIDVPGIVTIPE